MITLCATFSLVADLNRGIRRLSEPNILLAVLLLMFVFLAGPSAIAARYGRWKKLSKEALNG